MNLKFFIPAIAYFIVTTVLLCLPGNELPKSDLFDIPHFDKYVHTFLFLFLVVVFYYPISLVEISRETKKAWLIRIAMYSLAYGIVMEFVQKYLIPHRSFDEVDIVFDLLGCLLGAIVSWKFTPKK